MPARARDLSDFLGSLQSEETSDALSRCVTVNKILLWGARPLATLGVPSNVCVINFQNERGAPKGASQVAGTGFACPDERKETTDLRVMSSNPIPVPSDRQTLQLSQPGDLGFPGA